MDIRVREQSKSRKAVQAEAAKVPGSETCPHCGAHLDGNYEFCPVCGGKLVDYCTFCGAPMGPSDVDCPECGMPSDGVICPTCNIRNMRSFCGQCGQPLSRAARAAVEKAKKDPKVQEAARLIMKVAELEAELDGLADDEDSQDDTPQGPTEAAIRLKELLSGIGFTPQVTPSPKARKIGRSRAEIMAEYQKAIEDTNAVLESMVPPPGTTPQEQRNYYTARKVAVMETVQETWRGVPLHDSMAWECNYCKVLHNNPNECCKPQMGGRWVPCVVCEVVKTGGQLFTTNVEKKVYKRQ